jgi:hypothetical protein
MSVALDRNNIEKRISRSVFVAVRRYRAKVLRQYRVTTALEIAHEKARQYLQNSLPARPGAF